MSDLKKLTGLWPNRSGRGYGVKLRRDIVLKAGDRLLLFKIAEGDRKENGPTLELLVAEAQDAAGEPGMKPADVRMAIAAQAPLDGSRGQRRASSIADDLDDEIPF